MRCNGSNWAVYSPGSWDGFRNDVWALWAGEHHLVGGYVSYISPYIIIIIIIIIIINALMTTCCLHNGRPQKVVHGAGRVITNPTHLHRTSPKPKPPRIHPSGIYTPASCTSFRRCFRPTRRRGPCPTSRYTCSYRECSVTCWPNGPSNIPCAWRNLCRCRTANLKRWLKWFRIILYVSGAHFQR